MSMKSSSALAPAIGIALVIGITAYKGTSATQATLSAVLSPSPVAGRPSTLSGFSDVVFLHHSVGSNLIEQGRLRGLLTDRGFQFWDQGYNEDGLHLPDGTNAPYGYNVPDDNTDPDGLANIFSQQIDAASLTSDGVPANTLSGLLRHNAIVFKSCYPVTFIRSDDDLARYQVYYRQIRNTVDQHPDHLFIALTPPPLEPVGTNSPAASRARLFANWLKSPDFLAGHPNLFVFDLFDLLAEPDATRPDANMLRQDYRQEVTGLRDRAARTAQPVITFLGIGGHLGRFGISDDSHPNAAANKSVAPVLAEAIRDATTTFETTTLMANKS